MSHSSTRNAVYLVTVPDDFRPQRPWDLPPVILSAELYDGNLAITHVQGFCRVFNRRQLRLRLPDRRWALAVKAIRFADQTEPVRGDWDVSIRQAEAPVAKADAAESDAQSHQDEEQASRLPPVLVRSGRHGPVIGMPDELAVIRRAITSELRRVLNDPGLEHGVFDWIADEVLNGPLDLNKVIGDARAWAKKPPREWTDPKGPGIDFLIDMLRMLQLPGTFDIPRSVVSHISRYYAAAASQPEGAQA